MTNEHQTPEPESREVPIVEEDFATLLKKFKVKTEQATNIAEHISLTGGATVFEAPELLASRLAAWSSELTPAKRKLILEQWFAEKGIAVSGKLLEEAGSTAEQIKKAEAERGAMEVRYVYDPSERVVRMARKDEPGGTMAQATQLKKMAETDEGGGKESPFIMDGQGSWVFNPKARITGVEVMAFEMIKGAQAKGEPLDPMDAMVQAAEKMKIYREAMGGGSALPTWMSDPTEFIARIRTIQGEGSASEILRAELADVKKSLADMKDDKFHDILASQQQQIVALTQRLTELTEIMKDPSRLPGAKTEMDILYKIADEGIGTLKSELPSVRKDIREALGGMNLPPGKTSEERETRKGRYSKALQDSKELEALGRRLFFEES